MFMNKACDSKHTLWWHACKTELGEKTLIPAGWVSIYATVYINAGINGTHHNSSLNDTSVFGFDNDHF